MKLRWYLLLKASEQLIDSSHCFLVTFQLCNAYTELNNPVVQRQRFSQQLKV